MLFRSSAVAVHRRERFQPALEKLEDRRLLSFNEFLISTASSGVWGIAVGPDANLWFAESDANQIGQITTDGVVTEFALPTPSSRPVEITAGPDGNLWFAEDNANQIGRITPDGTVTEFPIATAGSRPLGITAGADGNLWFNEWAGNKIGQITPDGAITEFPVPTGGSHPRLITAGPDGNVWFTEVTANKIGQITPDGIITEFQVPTPNSAPYGITAGADGNVWFTEGNGSSEKIGQITPDGTTVTEFALSTVPGEIAAGPDGNLWFTESANRIGQITLDGAIREFQIPTSSSFPLGITAGPDGNIWFTENQANQIGQFIDDGSHPGRGSTGRGEQVPMNLGRQDQAGANRVDAAFMKENTLANDSMKRTDERPPMVDGETGFGHLAPKDSYHFRMSGSVPKELLEVFFGNDGSLVM
jgi:virginiamycin B lyase